MNGLVFTLIFVLMLGVIFGASILLVRYWRYARDPLGAAGILSYLGAVMLLLWSLGPDNASDNPVYVALSILVLAAGNVGCAWFNSHLKREL